ncbi:MAG: DUF2150 family protein [Halobacteria archaeon]|nr:DUF2150 family protein [Halobacteria archaeon]
MEEDEGFYTRERWNNWVERIREEEFDPESEDSARLFFNLQDDVTIACAKLVKEHDEGDVGSEEALEELTEIREVVLDQVEIEDEDKHMMLDGVQTSLMGVMASCEEYLANGADPEGDVEDYIYEAKNAEDNGEMERSLGLISKAGAKILDGEEFDIEEIYDDLEYGFVSEWVNGLDSLHDAVKGPETIEEDDEDEDE